MVKRIMSVTMRIEGRGGKMYSFWAWYSLRMSFWIVPESAARSTLVLSPTATYWARATMAGPLIVIEVDTALRSISANRSSMSASVSMATPARPTSPVDQTSSSESRPINVGMSNAVDSPVPPWRRMSLNRPLVSTAVPNPANIRMVHSRLRYISG